MSLADDCIAAIDQALDLVGEDIVLRRMTGTQRIPLDVTCRARVVEYQPQELSAEIIQGDSKVILSATEMQSAQWCWPPRNGDVVVVEGRTRTVVTAPPFYVDGRLVRIEMTVRG